jgi:hypothetical protein
MRVNMGEKVNVVVAFLSATLSNIDVDKVTSELAFSLLGARPKTWMSIRGMLTSQYQWPPTQGEMGGRLKDGEIVAAYPVAPAGGAAGAVVWARGSRATTASVSIPIRLAPKSSRAALARAAMETCRSAALCAVGSELELSGDDNNSLAVDEVVKRPDVELVSFLGASGEVEIVAHSRNDAK